MTSSADALVRHDLGSTGDRWLRQSLAQGKTLSAQLSNRIELQQGTAFTLVPPETDESRIRRWEEGGLVSSVAALDRLVQFLRPRLQEPQLYLVAENAVARPTDPVLRESEGNRFFVGEEVYEFVGPGAKAEDIRACLRRADAGFSLNAVVAALTRAPRQNEEPEFFRETLDQPEIVVVRAYDGESFVVWERSR